MTPTLLFDLDDTLLGNSMDVFIPAYLHALTVAMSDRVSPEQLVPALMAGVQAMNSNTDFRRTLKDVFDEVFYPWLGLDPVAILPAIEDFYTRVFPSLKEHTRTLPVAREMVSRLLSQGHTIAVSSNPLFPLTAIHQRLEWAGLSPDEFGFSAVTSMEISHFTKPSPSYFAEVLAGLGWPEGPIVIIGDNPINDIQPATELGVASYRVNNGSANRNPNAPGGLLEEFEPWLAAQQPDALTPKLDSLAAVLATMRTAHIGASHLAAGQTPDTLSTRPAEEDWSVTEILCHFRDVDREVTIPRIDSILQSENPFIVAVNPDEWAGERNYKDEDPAAVFDQWSETRFELMTRLDSLNPTDWDRTARHTIFGPITLLELMRISARHDRLHIQQIHKSLARLAPA
ncbi:MAG: hypothetical protein EPO32_00235 [Anaerolineae bacterium]|nr:MAG: hypothetical protein EPO32_00235 [Anaerolineae bacterium]